MILHANTIMILLLIPVQIPTVYVKLSYQLIFCSVISVLVQLDFNEVGANWVNFELWTIWLWMLPVKPDMENTSNIAYLKQSRGPLR
jgi:hypothetical protein